MSIVVRIGDSIKKHPVPLLLEGIEVGNL